MKIAIGNDHVALEMKQQISAYLEELGHEVIDFGTHTTERCDYPVYGEQVANAVVSGQAITLATMRFCTAFLMGLNGAASVMIGHEVGKGERERVQLQGKTFYLLSVAGGLIGGLLIWLISPLIAGAYGLSPEAYDATMQMMRAMSLLMVFQAVQSVMSKGVLRGGGDTRFLMFADLVFLWLLNIPLGYMAGLVWGWTPFWVFVCLKLDVICKSILCLWRLLSGKWIKNVNTEHTA